MSRLEELLQEKADLLDNIDKDFLEKITTFLKSKGKDINDFLARFEQRNGLFVVSDFNREMILNLKKFLLDELRPVYNFAVTDVIKTIDKTYSINEAIQVTQGVKGFADIVSQTIARQMTVDAVTSFLGFENNAGRLINDGVGRLLFQNVIGAASRKDTETSISTYLSDPDTGFVGKASVAARDAVATYDGHIQDELTKKIKYDGYFYLGTIINTSRPQCRHWVNNLHGFITFEELEKEVQKWKSSQGYDSNKVLTAEDFAKVRGGYNCRHQATAGFMTRQVRKLKGLE